MFAVSIAYQTIPPHVFCHKYGEIAFESFMGAVASGYSHVSAHATIDGDSYFVSYDYNKKAFDFRKV